ncbi:MAG: metallophosphoesterase [Candidatus Eiseniibacteriota bacterium]|nr:MAG: metallophosphoesterase [Candidatus Eisenbacteria bacterium]
MRKGGLKVNPSVNRRTVGLSLRRPLQLLLVVLQLLFLSTVPTLPSWALDWGQECYDDGSWPSGNAELGYGDGDEATLVTPGRITYYFRASFLVNDLEDASSMYLKVNYDDAFVAYINGFEVARSANMPGGTPTYSTLALSEHEGGSFEMFNITWFAIGEYLPYTTDYELNLSVEVHQVAAGDDDCSFDAEVLVSGVSVLPPGSMTRYFDSGTEPPVFRSDPISTIQRPLPNIPAIVPRGDTLDIICGASSSTTGWTAFLVTDFCTEMLSVSSATYDTPTKRWFLRAPIPPECAMELYDLVVLADGLTPDTTWNSVKIIDAFKQTFYFLHVTDSHVPEHFGTNHTADEFQEILNEAAIMNPEFIIHTGDYINRSHADQTEMGQIVLKNTEVPFYLTTGNHDIGDGMAHWWNYMGWNYLYPYSADNFGVYTPDYSFDYGDCHFTLPAAYRNYSYFIYEVYGWQSFIASQMSWINSDLSAASGAALKVMAYHYDFQSQLPSIFSTYGIDLALLGHSHMNSTQYVGSTLSILTNRSYNEGSPGNARLIRVTDNAVTAYPLIYNFQNIGVAYENPNDGTSSTNTATITSNHSEGFDNALVKLLVLDYGGDYTVTGGTVSQVIDAGAFLVHYVNTNVPGYGNVEITIEPASTSVSEGPSPIARVALSGAHPNPFNPWTTIHYELFPRTSHGASPENSVDVLLRVFDATGRMVRELVHLTQGPGSYYVSWDGKDENGSQCSSGVYLAVLEAAGQTGNAKLVLLR